MIPYGRQEITASDIDAVVDVLKSDFLTQGPKVPLFEKTVSEKVGANYAIAVNSATSALHIACMALELGDGDLLWTSPVTFVASANAGLYCGAKVDFVDIDPVSYNICPKKLEEKFLEAQLTNSLPKVLVAVHLCGQPCDMSSISRLCSQYNVKIIEDSSHAIGGRYKEDYIGCCRYSDITVFSFHPVKIITTAEGGMALTNSKALSTKMDLYRSHGITRDPKMMIRNSDGPWYYEQVDLGYNYRMTELQAALGINQMHRLDAYVAKRHELAQIYDKHLRDLPVILPQQHSDGYSGRHLYVIRLRLCLIKKTRLEVFTELRENGIGVNVHYIPVHTQPFYQSFGFVANDFPESIRYYEEAISLPLFQTLTLEDQVTVIETLRKVLTE